MTTLNDNMGRFYRSKRYLDPSEQIFEGNASSVSFRTTMVDNDTLYIQISVPTGKKLVVYDRKFEPQDGLYFIDVCTIDSYTGGTTTGVVRRPLNAGNGSVDSVMRTGITPSGLEVIEYGQIDEGTGLGAANVPGSPSVDDIGVTLQGDNNVIRIQRTGSGTVNVTFRIIAWEVNENEV